MPERVSGRNRIAAMCAVVALTLGAAGCGASTPRASHPPTTARSTTTHASIPSTTTTTGAPTTTTTTAPASTTTSTSTTTSSSTAPTAPARQLWRGDPSKMVVALTFDAGSDTGFTASILDTLRERHVLATFGLTGRWVEANPALAHRIVAEGHAVLNHTYDHRSFTGASTHTVALSASERASELARADSAIAHATGRSAKPWFRPPYGDIDASVAADAGANGYRYEVLWTVDSLGWQGASVAEITNRCLARSEPGAIFLFHVGSASQDAAALGAVIDGLRARGYGFVTVPQLVGS